MAYLNLDPNYFDHPKTKRLIGMLGKGAEIYPLKLWCYCAKYHPDQGLLQGYLPEEIEGIVGWSGEKTILVSAMKKVGFLKKKGKSYEVNDWLDHEGHISNFSKRSKLANKIRWDKYKKLRTPTRTPKKEIKESPLPNHTLPNLTNNILSQTKVLLTSFGNIKPLIEEYLLLAKGENKSGKIAPQKELRLLNELYQIYIQSEPKKFEDALRITVNNEAPNINYLKKVYKGQDKRIKVYQKLEAQKQKQEWDKGVDKGKEAVITTQELIKKYEPTPKDA